MNSCTHSCFFSPFAFNKQWSIPNSIYSTLYVAAFLLNVYESQFILPKENGKRTTIFLLVVNVCVCDFVEHLIKNTIVKFNWIKIAFVGIASVLLLYAAWMCSWVKFRYAQAGHTFCIEFFFFFILFKSDPIKMKVLQRNFRWLWHLYRSTT